MPDPTTTRRPGDVSVEAVRPVDDPWLPATLVGLQTQSLHSRTLTLSVPGWPGHQPGQHADLRLTAADGYSAQRSYSLAEPGTADRISVTVELLSHGEVSPYLAETMEIGDQLDLRGPIGGWFVWEPGDPRIAAGPVLLIAGGSGVVPLVTMLRARNEAADRTPMMLVYSLRGPRDLMYGPELAQLGTAEPDLGQIEIRLVYTRRVAEGYPRPAGHLTTEDITLPASWREQLAARVYVCGSSGFVDHATGLLRRVGYHDDRIRTERFGPTGVQR